MHLTSSGVVWAPCIVALVGVDARGPSHAPQHQHTSGTYPVGLRSGWGDSMRVTMSRYAVARYDVRKALAEFHRGPGKAALNKRPRARSGRRSRQTTVQKEGRGNAHLALIAMSRHSSRARYAESSSLMSICWSISASRAYVDFTVCLTCQEGSP